MGSWTWNSRLRRPVLSIFSAVYRLSPADIAIHHRRLYPLPPRVQAELRATLGVVPLLYSDLAAPFSDLVYATDASSSGAGVCYARGMRVSFGVRSLLSRPAQRASRTGQFTH